jgi:hypothetical protein
MPWSDYPQAMTDAARRGIRLNKERGGRCATAVGKETARILSSRGTLSDARVRRMRAYLERALTYYDPKDPEACGTISYLLWGGLPALRWSRRAVKKMKDDE